jgi:hypothetical protein
MPGRKISLARGAAVLRYALDRVKRILPPSWRGMNQMTVICVMAAGLHARRALTPMLRIEEPVLKGRSLPETVSFPI